MPAWLTWTALKSLPWKWIGLALALLAVVLWIDHRGYARGFHKRDAEVAGLHRQITDRDAASAKAAAENLDHVRNVETAQTAITKEKTDALATQLADARAALAAYVLRHKAGPGNAGQGGLPSAPVSPGAVDGADQQALVPVTDLDACAQAYVTATGWQDWWRAQAAISR